MKTLTDRKMKWSCTILIPFLVCCTLVLNHAERQMTNFLTVTVLGVLMFMFELIHMTVISMLLMAAYVIIGIAPMSVVFSGWLQESIWITFGCLVMVVILEKTTIMQRITFRLIILSGGTYQGILFALILLGIITNLLIPGVMVGVMIAALAFSLCQSLKLGKSPASAGIMIGALSVGFYDVETFILSPGNYTLITGSANEIIDLPVNYWTFFKDNWIFFPLVVIEALVLNKMFAPKDMGNVNEQFRRELNKLGEISKPEKKMVLVLFLLFVYLISQPMHKFPMWYGFIIAPAVLFFPGIELGKSEDMKKVNYNILVFMVACLGIGSTAVHIGIGDQLSVWAIENLSGLNKSVVICAIFLLAVLINFLMTPFAAMSTWGGTLAQISASLDISFYPVSYAFFFGCQTVIFPYETALFAILYGFGNIRLIDFIKFMLVRAVLWLLYLMIIGNGYWKLIGYI